MKDFIEVVDKDKQCLVIIPIDRILSVCDYDGKSAFIEVDIINGDDSIGILTEETYTQIKIKLKNLGKIL